MELKETITDEITDFISQHVGWLFPGCIAGYATANNRFSIAVGTQGPQIPMHALNIFDTASVTKALLHVLALKKVSFDELNQRVIDVIPMKGKYREDITVKHLLTFAVEYGDKKLSVIESRDALIEAVVSGDLPLSPGTSYRYTNISSMLLTLFLEKRFNKPLDVLLHDELFVPLGMNTTFFTHGQNYRLDERFVPTEFELDRGIVQDESARVYGAPTGSAGIFSTIDDLLIFGQSFLGKDTYLPKSLIRQMPHSQFSNTVAMTFGLGMGLRHQNECDLCDENGIPLTVLKKNGFSGVHFCVMPENDFCFVVFGNICYPSRPTAEKRDQFTRFHKNLLRLLYEKTK